MWIFPISTGVASPHQQGNWTLAGIIIRSRLKETKVKIKFFILLPIYVQLYKYVEKSFHRNARVFEFLMNKTYVESWIYIFQYHMNDHPQNLGSPGWSRTVPTASELATDIYTWPLTPLLRPRPHSRINRLLSIEKSKFCGHLYVIHNNYHLMQYLALWSLRQLVLVNIY